MSKLPLEGIRIVLTPLVIAGPYASMMLADMGAEVILVESIKFFSVNTRGIMPRPPEAIIPTEIKGQTLAGGRGGMGTYFDHTGGERPWDRFCLFHAFNRNKLSCCIDMTDPEGLAVFKRLLKASDVYIDSSAVTVAEKQGLTEDIVSEINPDIVHVRMPALGVTGPHRDCCFFGAQLQAIAGHTWLTRYPDLDYGTTQSHLFHSDAAAGATAAFAILCALNYRQRSGKGQFIDLSQLETVIPHLGEAIMDYTINGRIQEPAGNRDPQAAPQGVYPSRGEDRWVAISVSSQEEWQGLCRAMGNPEWCDQERFATFEGRMANHDELDALIGEWTKLHDQYDAMVLLQREGVAAGPVLDSRDVTNDPQLVGRGFFEPVHHREAGSHRYPGVVWKMEKTPLSIRKPPPCQGEHNDYVFREVIGMSEDEISDLESRQVIGGEEYII
ncbi:MAG: CoA transferase [Dehalococcoidia bacterium]